MNDPGTARSRFKLLPALGWSLSWGVGAGLGVAVGAWLTVVGEAGAPGIESLDPGSDFIVLPLIALIVVTLVHLAGQSVVAAVRAARERRRSPVATASEEVER